MRRIAEILMREALEIVREKAEKKHLSPFVEIRNEGAGSCSDEAGDRETERKEDSYKLDPVQMKEKQSNM